MTVHVFDPSDIEDDECFCGTCGTCRRALRLIDRTLDKPILTLETHAAEAAVKAAKTAAKTVTKAPASTPLSSVSPVSTSSTAAQDEDAARRSERIVSEKSPSPNEESRAKNDRRNQRRIANKAERVLVDGYWVHPKESLEHGTSNAYADHGCRCEPCREYGYASYRRARDKKKNA